MRLLVTSGRGPAECRMAVGIVVEMVRKDAEDLDLEVSIISGPKQDEHGPASVVVVLDDGDIADRIAQDWCGSIQRIQKSTIRPNHKRKNWFVSVSRLADPEKRIEIAQGDIRFDAFRAGGPGGQHQNTTDSAIRATHTPSGMTVVARDGRSQHRNKAIAIERLVSLLEAQADIENGRLAQEAQRCHDGLERGNPVKVIE